jgi:uncharacterized protein DUF547
MSGMEKQLAEALEAAKSAYFDARGAACDYAVLASSAERARLAAGLAALEGFDIRRSHIPSQMAFWINVFNAGVLRDASELRLAASAREVQAFFERPRLTVGAHAYSLDDIEHGLLRGNAPKQGRSRAQMASDDPRLEYMPILFDERMHFALHSACRSSPPLRVFDGGKLDRQLEEAAADYVHRTVRVESEGAVLALPRLFRWFAEDFGGDSGIVEFVVARIDDEAAVEKVDRRLGRVKLHYAEFDWTLNRK